MMLQVSEMQVYSCTFFKIGFSLDANTQSRMGFIDAVKLILSIPSVFHFQPYNDQYCSVNQ